jgi:hypothetical protein
MLNGFSSQRSGQMSEEGGDPLSESGPRHRTSLVHQNLADEKQADQTYPVQGPDISGKCL